MFLLHMEYSMPNNTRIRGIIIDNPKGKVTPTLHLRMV